METYLKLLKKMVRLRPVSADMEAVNRASEMLHEFLQKQGLVCIMENMDGRKILFASTQEEKKPLLLLNAHLDVVPAVDDSQYEAEVKNGIFFARGAGDCLGNAVCIAKALCELNKDFSVGAIFSTDEEIGGHTTRYMVEQGYGAKRIICIMDSWENDNIAYAQKGFLSLKLTAYGRGGHSSHPWDFDNPVEKLIESCARLRKNWKNPTAKDPWHSSMTMTVLKAGLVANQIPDNAEIQVNVRYTEKQDREKILAEIQNITGLDITILDESLPVAVSTNSVELKLLLDCVTEGVGKKPSLIRINGATDARWFAPMGVPVAISGIEAYGIHACIENAKIDSIRQYADILKAFAMKLHE